MPETYGDYKYFITEKEFEKSKFPSKNRGSNTYIQYCRHPSSLAYESVLRNPQDSQIEVVLDIQDDLVASQFIPYREAKITVVDKIKMNTDHSKIGFTVDIGNQEVLTGGIKCMKTGKVLPNIRLENISCMEFAADGENVFYVVTDEHNRPYKVKTLNIETG